jgi:serine/threonine protein kinase/WD40 repeat protein/tetratricopeptide (TPR) repeat protein
MTTNDTASGSDHGPVDRLAEEFLERHRRGERPTISEYAGRHPELADEIRDVFPALLMMERLRPASADLTCDRRARSAEPEGTHDLLGDYRILREVGRGGMGVVYEAVQEALGRHVALKVLPWHGRMDAGQIERFHLEARSAAKLHHTNIVPVFDIGEHRGVHFYSMQFIQGTGLDVILRDLRRLRDRASGEAGPRPEDTVTLSVARAHGLVVPRPTEVARPGTVVEVPRATSVGGHAVPPPSPPPPEQSELIGSSVAQYHLSVARIGSRVADALAYAHAQGVLHRDIKPSNLLLDSAGEVWVADFGLAKVEGSEGPTRVGDVVGTVRYMAPERFEGRSDPRSDVYGLGATLYELLALQPAFEGEDRLALINRIAREVPAPLRQFDRHISRDLEAIVLRCLAKDPRDRFATAAELRDELHRVLQNRPTRTRPLSPPEKLWRWCRRNPLIAGLNALAASLTIVIAVVSTVAAYRNGRLADRVNVHLSQARRNLFQAYTTEAEARRQSRRVGQRFEALDAIARAVRLATSLAITEGQRSKLRNEAIAAMALPDLRVARELDVPRAVSNGIALDPAFRRYAFKRDDGTVVVRGLSDGAELFHLPGLPPAGEFAAAEFSPDGRYLLMTAGNHAALQVWDLVGRRLLLTDRELQWSTTSNWSIHPDGRELAVGHADGSVVFHELPSGKPLRRWTQPASSAWVVAYSPDGLRVAVPDRGGTVVQILSSDDGRVLARLPHPGHAQHLAWNPRRHNLLAVSCADRVIYVWDVNTRKQTQALHGESESGLVLAYHPGGELLASRGWHDVLRVWDTRTGQMILSRPSRWSSTLAFDATGRRLGVEPTPGRARVLELAEASECRTLVAEPFRATDRHKALAVDPTGRRLATTGGLGVVVWDLPTGATLASLPVSHESNSILIDPSGAVLTESPFVLRWPVAEAADGVTTIGPPALLLSQGTRDGFVRDQDGRTIAMAVYNDGALVLDTQATRPPRRLRPHRDVRHIAISPDGRRIVTGSHPADADGLKLWDAASGRLIHDFPSVPDEARTVRAFSPDGRWLAVAWDGLVLFDTATWAPRVRLSRGESWWIAFAPDSRTAVFDDHAGTLVLAEVETGRELARFEDPEQARVNRVAFTPDGTQIVTTLLERPYLRAWDLRAVRSRLAGLGLDWTPPADLRSDVVAGPYRPLPNGFRVDRGQLDAWLRPAAESLPQVVERTTRAIEANPVDPVARSQRASALAGLKRFAEAIDDLTVALKARPDDAHLLVARGRAAAGLGRLDAALADCEAAMRCKPSEAERESLSMLCNNLAWPLVSGPAAGRDPPRALSLARHAVTLVPGRADYLNTLGVALYRAARFAEAVPVLEQSLAAGRGESDAFDLLFLAMARQRLGQSARARADFDRAVNWRREHRQLPAQSVEELNAFQAEAQQLLSEPPVELPTDVFTPADSP